MPSQTSSNNVPAPPRPDPVTLEQIYDTLTSTVTSMEDKAYQLVALNTVAFHPSVKLFMFEHTHPQHNSELANDSKLQSVNEENRLFREKLLKSVAFFLAQRNSAVCKECRWETVSLLGELCRMDNTHGTKLNIVTSTNPDKNSDNNSNNKQRVPSSPQTELEYKLNMYAKSNLEYLASLPWFVPAVEAIIGIDILTSMPSVQPANNNSNSNNVDKVNNSDTNNLSSMTATTATATTTTTSSSSSSRSALKERLRVQRTKLHQQSDKNEDDDDVKESDEDVVIALKDILLALPRKVSITEADTCCNNIYNNKFEWSEANLTQAYDLMFIDASTSMLHYIPPVSRNSSNYCAYCNKLSEVSHTKTNNNNNNDNNNNSNESKTRIVTKEDAEAKPVSLLRCASCKSVYYCSPQCQAAHWRAAHKMPCTAYKKRCDEINSAYEELNHNTASKHKKKSKRVANHKNECNGSSGSTGVTILEVPLEPTLFYETRRYLYDHRDSYFANVSFNDYFMKYTTHGN